MIEELIKFIKEVFRDEVYTNISISIEPYELAVFLDFDPENEGDKEKSVKLVYDGLTESYIDNKHYVAHGAKTEYGPDAKELIRFAKILEFMDQHGSKYDDLVNGLDWQDRITQEQKLIDYRYNAI